MSELLKLENQLCHRFYTLSNAFTRAYRPLLKTLDITYPQYVTLMALWENDDITIANLLEVTDIDGGAMSLILKKLEAKGFLTVIKDDNDKRVRRVKLTTEGIAKKAVAEEVPTQMLCKLQGMTKEESHMLRDLLDKLGGCFSQSASDDNL
ncbi:MarR family transcriptional regulator [Alteromonas sp. McT4-15]|uniref:MarR family winged helix-turn-helix transcriptional regulator n=1 Tax=unclassified Alteromonas TaxID=2614992 RepID=UPI0012E4820B|nr:MULTISPECIES: MarR family transcriptional regulator [unclassified Alteromonas]MCB4436184.1 MarR family transcriptional regulator [Alteromonas sp. McT4-15]BCO17941.1 MarR family transcriptional regulator [Alteromonas sp. KC3]BCO21902.1 MarR family transcriptional regulator [Alteromonas sp. KC14]GFD88313.1 MarR family transcriptional regulator [Tenacibaculum sp. KUL152]